jgi:hypothetical protein
VSIIGVRKIIPGLLCRCPGDSTLDREGSNIMAMSKHALAVLIDQVKEDQGWSDEDLAQRARRAGHQISKQQISLLRTTDPIRTIVPSTLRALADAMGKPLAVIVEAAIPSAGLPSGRPEDWSPETAIRADSELTEQSKRLLLSLLREARLGGEAGEHGRESAPMTTRHLRAAHEQSELSTPRRPKPKRKPKDEDE